MTEEIATPKEDKIQSKLFDGSEDGSEDGSGDEAEDVENARMIKRMEFLKPKSKDNDGFEIVSSSKRKQMSPNRSHEKPEAKKVLSENGKNGKNKNKN